MDFALIPIIHRIQQVERLKISVSPRLSHDRVVSPDPSDYYFSRAAARKMTVGRWCETRFTECYPFLSVKVLSEHGRPLPNGTLLGHAENSDLLDVVYFADIVASLKFKSDKFAIAAKRRLKAAGIRASIEDDSFLLWKSYLIHIELGLVLLSPIHRVKFRLCLSDLASEFDGQLEQFEVGYNQYLSEPFDIKRAGVTEVDLANALGGF